MSNKRIGLLNLTPSRADIAFRTAFELGLVSPSDFHHRDHLRLAYVWLCEGDVGSAHGKIRLSIRRFLAQNGIDAAKYHETLTLAWIQAVRHFMALAGEARSFDDFVARDDRLLDSAIMLTHYRRETLFSDTARLKFVTPDLAKIPQH